MATRHADFLVLGAGPGGYAAAFRAADLGREVVLVDPRTALGGVCLNEGCIPSKTLLHAAKVLREVNDLADWGVTVGKPLINLDRLRQRKTAITQKLAGGLAGIANQRKVTVVKAFGRFTGESSLEIAGEDWTFGHAVVAVGSAAIRLPGWPEHARIWDSTIALELREIPPSLAIVGGGIVGLEMATIYSALGSDVTVIELSEQIVPAAEAEAARMVANALMARGIKIHTATAVLAVDARGDHLMLSCGGSFSGEIGASVVIQSIGRAALGGSIHADLAGVEVAGNGVIVVDRSGRTSNPKIYAVGDVTGAPMLAHRATHQGKIAAEAAAGHAAVLDTDIIPSVAYTDPELAWAGLTSGQAQAEGIPHKTISFPWSASGRNLASGGETGLTKLVYDPQTERLLGATLVGANAGELLAEIVLAMEMGATLTDIALTVHPHPTLSETIAFAAERALGTLTDL